MGSPIVNLGQIQDYTMRTESLCKTINGKFTQFVENPQSPFCVSSFAKLFMKALNHLDEGVRKRQEKERRIYFDEEPVSFLLHEASQSAESVIKHMPKYGSKSTTPASSDTEG